MLIQRTGRDKVGRMNADRPYTQSGECERSGRARALSGRACTQRQMAHAPGPEAVAGQESVAIRDTMNRLVMLLRWMDDGILNLLSI